MAHVNNQSFYDLAGLPVSGASFPKVCEGEMESVAFEPPQQEPLQPCCAKQHAGSTAAERARPSGFTAPRLLRQVARDQRSAAEVNPLQPDKVAAEATPTNGGEAVPQAPGLFSFASGRGVTVSSAARQRAATLLQDDFFGDAFFGQEEQHVQDYTAWAAMSDRDQQHQHKPVLNAHGNAGIMPSGMAQDEDSNMSAKVCLQETVCQPAAQPHLPVQAWGPYGVLMSSCEDSQAFFSHLDEQLAPAEVPARSPGLQNGYINQPPHHAAAPAAYDQPSAGLQRTSPQCQPGMHGADYQSLAAAAAQPSTGTGTGIENEDMSASTAAQQGQPAEEGLEPVGSNIVQGLTGQVQRPLHSGSNGTLMEGKGSPGLATASGKGIQVSSEAWQCSHALLEEERPHEGTGGPDGELRQLPHNRETLWASASGKPLQVSEAALARAKQVLGEEAGGEDSMVLASHAQAAAPQHQQSLWASASGKPLQASDAALARAKQLLGEEYRGQETGDLDNVQDACVQQQPPVWASASGRPLQISDEGMARAKQLLGEEQSGEEAQCFKGPPYAQQSLWASASGKQLHISDAGLARAKRLLGQERDGQEIEPASNAQEAAIPDQQPSLWASASGKPLELSDAGLARAKQLLGDDGLDADAANALPAAATIMTEHLLPSHPAATECAAVPSRHIVSGSAGEGSVSAQPIAASDAPERHKQPQQGSSWATAAGNRMDVSPDKLVAASLLLGAQRWTAPNGALLRTPESMGPAGLDFTGGNACLPERKRMRLSPEVVSHPQTAAAQPSSLAESPEVRLTIQRSQVVCRTMCLVLA